MAKPKASQETVQKFIATIYPQYTELAMSTGTEETILNDAVELIKSLRSEIVDLRAMIEEADNDKA